MNRQAGCDFGCFGAGDWDGRRLLHGVCVRLIRSINLGKFSVRARTRARAGVWAGARAGALILIAVAC